MSRIGVGGELATATPMARALAEAELELADRARRLSDYARGMMPTGAPTDSEPGALLQDALQVARLARQVLVAAANLERTRGTPEDVVSELLSSSETTANPNSLIRAAAPAADPGLIEDRLFDLDSWVRRHAEPDDPPILPQPVTTAVLRHLRAPQ
jgi:hypothetical protein